MAGMDRAERSFLGWFALVFAVGALFLAMFGLRDGSAAGAATASASASASVDVTLTEFAISPQMISLPVEGGTMKVTNKGSAIHNFSVPELGVNTGDINPGATVEAKVGRVAEGMYPALCEIAGHAASGMAASVMIGNAGGGDGTASAGATPTTMSWQEMDKLMADVAAQFPAKTAGHGGDRLDPKVLADGTKEFDLEAKVVKWEVSPGKLVDAWTYNGVVPAPEIHVNDGDKVRIVLKNSLPES